MGKSSDQCQFLTDFPGQPIGPIFMYNFPRNAIDPRRDHTSLLLGGGSLKSCNVVG